MATSSKNTCPLYAFRRPNHTRKNPTPSKKHPTRATAIANATDGARRSASVERATVGIRIACSNGRASSTATSAPGCHRNHRIVGARVERLVAGVVAGGGHQHQAVGGRKIDGILFQQ